jgi:uncharacterized RDD family membrane protein YckC
LIDYLVVVVIYVCISVALRMAAAGSQVAGLAFALYLVAAWIYSAGLESSAKQATLGKLALGIKVTDLGGQRIGFGRATGRYFAHIVTALTIGVGYAVAVFTRKRQTVHDMIAETLVVRSEFSPEQIAEAGPAPRVPLHVAVLSVIAILLIGPFGLGLMASIAIPAYQAYTIRAQVTEGLRAAAPYQTAVVQAHSQGIPFSGINTQTLSVSPDTNLKFVDSVRVVSGVVAIKYGRSANRLIAQRSVLLVPGVDNGKNIVWICGHSIPATQLDLAAQDTSKYTTVADRYLPPTCRAGP